MRRYVINIWERAKFEVGGCYVNNIPFISIRCITDTATHSGTGHFEENCEKAAMIAKDITVALLTEIHDK